MGKFIDITGWVMKEHGVPDSRLTVVERAEDYISPSGKHETRWRCICECGNEVVVTRSRIKGNNATKSCGCLQKEKASLSLNDLTGQIFGRLTVLERAEVPEHVKDKHSTYWKCECKCGKITVVRRDALIHGDTQSCGCIHDEKSSERIKTIFTKDYRKYNEQGNLIEKFCPTCGRWLNPTNFSPSKSVLDGYSYECKECYNYSTRNRYKSYRGSANHRKLEFDLTLDEFDEITSKPCVYCGGCNGDYFGKQFSGVDRINSQKGYVLNNCVPCCQTCNAMKSNLTVKDWIEHITLILNYYNKKDVDLDVQ